MFKGFRQGAALALRRREADVHGDGAEQMRREARERGDIRPVEVTMARRAHHAEIGDRAVLAARGARKFIRAIKPRGRKQSSQNDVRRNSALGSGSPSVTIAPTGRAAERCRPTMFRSAAEPRNMPAVLRSTSCQLPRPTATS